MHTRSLAAGGLSDPIKFPLDDEFLKNLSEQVHAPRWPPGTGLHLQHPQSDPFSHSRQPPTEQAEQYTHHQADTLQLIKRPNLPDAQLSAEAIAKLPRLSTIGDPAVTRQFHANLIAQGRLLRNPHCVGGVIYRGTMQEILSIYQTSVSEVNAARVTRNEAPLVAGIVQRDVIGKPRSITVAAERDDRALAAQMQRKYSPACPPGFHITALKLLAQGPVPPEDTSVQFLAAYVAGKTNWLQHGRSASAHELSVAIAAAGKLASRLPVENPLRQEVAKQSSTLMRDVEALAGSRETASILLKDAIGEIAAKSRESAVRAARESMGESFKPEASRQPSSPADRTSSSKPASSSGRELER